MELYQDKPEVEAKAAKKEEPKNKLAAAKWVSQMGKPQMMSSFWLQLNRLALLLKTVPLGVEI